MTTMPLPSHSQAVGKGATTVVVLYHPDDGDIANLVRLSRSGPVIAVVNALDPSRREILPQDDDLLFVHNPRNMGLAHALNQGIEAAFERGADHVLLLDQDSRPADDMIARLADAATAIEARGRALACVAPLLHDLKFGPIAAVSPADEVVSTASFATSGTLITRNGWTVAGPMWDALFIDGIDHEWCFRARARGLETVQLPRIVMPHDMGEAAINILGRFKPIHRSPVRHYFIVRNTLWLMRRGHIPRGWRFGEGVKLLYRIPAYVWFSSDRRRSIANLLRAVADGITGNATRQHIVTSRTS